MRGFEESAGPATHAGMGQTIAGSLCAAAQPTKENAVQRMTSVCMVYRVPILVQLRRF